VKEQKNWFTNTVYHMKINASEGKEARELMVIPKQVFMHPARRGHVMSINFIEFVPGRKYNFPLPVRFQGLADCQGTKTGGVFLFGQEEIECTYQGDHNIPRDIVCDLVSLERGAVVRLSDLGKFPPNLKLKGRLAKANPVLCNIAKTGGEASRNTPPWMVVEDNEWKKKKAESEEREKEKLDQEAAKMTEKKNAAKAEKEAKAGGAKDAGGAAKKEKAE